jgi:hypothetical protein
MSDLNDYINVLEFKKNKPIKFNSIEEIYKKIKETKLDSLRLPYSKRIQLVMLLGNGDKHPFTDIEHLKKTVNKFHTSIPQYSFVLYFGDKADENKPDIGYATKYLSYIRPDLRIIMIQIKEMEKYGVPDFVNEGYYFHDDYDPSDKNHKWGGYEKVNGKYKVYSNTKQWQKLHFLLKQEGIDDVYVLGKGGPVTQQSLELIKNINEFTHSKNNKDTKYISVDKYYVK